MKRVVELLYRDKDFESYHIGVFEYSRIGDKYYRNRWVESQQSKQASDRGTMEEITKEKFMSKVIL